MAVDEHRGKDPSNTIGAPDITLDTGRADPARVRKVLTDLAGKGKGDRPRPHREDVLPYLLIRTVPGDRGKRPTWTPVPCWESPDLLLIDASYTGPFDPAQCVAQPTSGNTYRAFVRVYNLGMVPAVGTQVTLYWVDPGFFGPNAANYQPQFIGGAFVDLADRTRPEAVQVVEIEPAWSIPYSLTGHECLLAIASCVADRAAFTFDSNDDRHVGQRNLTIATGHAPLSALINLLAERIPQGGAVELMHGGAAVEPLLAALGRGQGDVRRTAHRAAAPAATVGPVMQSIRQGVTLDDGLHLLTAVRRGEDVVVSPTELMTSAVPDIDSAAIVRYLHEADPQLLSSIAITGSGAAAHEVLGTALQRMLDIGDLEAGSIAAALGGGDTAAHLLRFVASDAEGRFVGGYSVIVSR